MKAKILMLTAALVLGAGAGCAHQKNSTEATGQNYKNLTGSYLPQDVDRNGPVSNGKSNVRVLDRSDIEGSGGADVKQAFRNLGVR